MVFDTLINTHTSGDQFTSEIIQLKDGSFVAVWASKNDKEGIYAQRYSTSGEKQGGEFLISTIDANQDEIEIGITSLDNGGFAVTWKVEVRDGDNNSGIHTQHYDANGVAQGSKFSETVDIDSIFTLKNGSFLRASETKDNNGNTLSQFVQFLDASGLPQDHKLSFDTIYDETDIVALNDGGFLIVWEIEDANENTLETHAQRYNADGVKIGSKLIFDNTHQEIGFDALSDGGFLITWETASQTNTHAQRYNADSVKTGSEFSINSTTNGGEFDGSISIVELKDGGLVVSWTSWQDQDIRAQRYDSSGVTQDNEFRVNTYTNDNQGESSVSALEDGGFVVTWSSTGQDGDGKGIYGKRYDTNSNEVEWFDFSPSADRLFDWAEITFADLFPNHAASQEIEGYHARIYESGNALGERNGNIYFYDSHSITLVGTVDDFLPNAIAAGF